MLIRIKFIFEHKDAVCVETMFLQIMYTLKLKN